MSELNLKRISSLYVMRSGENFNKKLGGPIIIYVINFVIKYSFVINSEE